MPVGWCYGWSKCSNCGDIFLNHDPIFQTCQIYSCDMFNDQARLIVRLNQAYFKTYQLVMDKAARGL